MIARLRGTRKWNNTVVKQYSAIEISSHSIFSWWELIYLSCWVNGKCTLSNITPKFDPGNRKTSSWHTCFETLSHAIWWQYIKTSCFIGTSSHGKYRPNISTRVLCIMGYYVTHTMILELNNFCHFTLLVVPVDSQRLMLPPKTLNVALLTNAGETARRAMLLQ